MVLRGEKTSSRWTSLSRFPPTKWQRRRVGGNGVGRSFYNNREEDAVWSFFPFVLFALVTRKELEEETIGPIFIRLIHQQTICIPRASEDMAEGAVGLRKTDRFVNRRCWLPHTFITHWSVVDLLNCLLNGIIR